MRLTPDTMYLTPDMATEITPEMAKEMLASIWWLAGLAWNHYKDGIFNRAKLIPQGPPDIGPVSFD